MRVVGIRGVSVGSVVRVERNAVLVKPRDGGREFWLGRDAVIGVEDGRVELICDAGEVRRYEVEGPGEAEDLGSGVRV